MLHNAPSVSTRDIDFNKVLDSLDLFALKSLIDNSFPSTVLPLTISATKAFLDIELKALVVGPVNGL